MTGALNQRLRPLGHPASHLNVRIEMLFKENITTYAELDLNTTPPLSSDSRNYIVQLTVTNSPHNSVNRTFVTATVQQVVSLSNRLL